MHGFEISCESLLEAFDQNNARTPRVGESTNPLGCHKSCSMSEVGAAVLRGVVAREARSRARRPCCYLIMTAAGASWGSM